MLRWPGDASAHALPTTARKAAHMLKFSAFVTALLVLLQSAAVVAGGTSADARRILWRWTDVRGQINYGDHPPANARNLLKIDLMTIGSTTQALLPYQLRHAASNFPVILYTTKDCPPCNSAREYLHRRGVPFAERTVESSDDGMELKRLTNAEGVPVATLGGQVMVAFDSDTWGSALDATGYPRTSMLPANFRQEPARPLTQRSPAPPAAQ